MIERQHSDREDVYTQKSDSSSSGSVFVVHSKEMTVMYAEITTLAPTPSAEMANTTHWRDFFPMQRVCLQIYERCFLLFCHGRLVQLEGGSVTVKTIEEYTRTLLDSCPRRTLIHFETMSDFLSALHLQLI